MLRVARNAADKAFDEAEEKERDETIAKLKEDKQMYLENIEKDAKLQSLSEENEECRVINLCKYEYLASFVI